ncbi:MAG: hypothetical protein LQ350_002588 [Teloschistes chrysophthalmus]|nr:MAG: hypothetical protein LQ350_002588 [Niorma chrysophthalma]
MRTNSTARFSAIYPGMLLILVIPLIFLSIYPGSSAKTKTLKHGQTLLEPRSATDITEANGTRSIGLAFGEQNYRPFFSRPLTKRQTTMEEASELYVLALCNGTQMLKRIQQANDLNVPGPDVTDFPPYQIANGWDVSDVRFIAAAMGRRWDDAWKDLFNSATRPGIKQQRYVALTWNKPFKNKFDENVQAFDFASNYANVFFCSPPAIISSSSRSPTNVLRQSHPGISRDELDHQIPPLNRWSDVAWTLWVEGEGKVHPEWLQYIGFDRVADPITLPVIKYILLTRYMNDQLPFPGAVFNTADEEGRALLGTPTGKGVGTPYFTIRIWCENGDYFLLFDLQKNPDQGGRIMRAPLNEGALPDLTPPSPT